MAAHVAYHHELSSADRLSVEHRLRAGLLVLFLLSAPPLLAQTRELRFERIALHPDITDYRAFDMAQDSIGFLWFATSEGLYRYDGLTTTAFKPRLNDTSAIASMTIWSVLTDRAGEVWLGTYDAGLDCIDPVSGTFRHFRHNPADSTSINSGPIRTLAEDHNGRIWIGTDADGLSRLDPSTGRFTKFRHDPATRKA